jgi:hypothetical protein
MMNGEAKAATITPASVVLNVAVAVAALSTLTVSSAATTPQ